MIYDEESDRHVHIEFRDALRYAQLGAANAAGVAVFGPAPAGDVLQKMTDSHAVGRAGKPTLEQLTAALTPGTYDAGRIASAVEAGVWVPVGLVIARPFIEHLMMSAVLAVSGRDTGATLFGPAGARWRLSGLCTLPRSRPSHATSRVRSQTCRSRPTRRSRRSRAT